MPGGKSKSAGATKAVKAAKAASRRLDDKALEEALLLNAAATTTPTAPAAAPAAASAPTKDEEIELTPEERARIEAGQGGAEAVMPEPQVPHALSATPSLIGMLERANPVASLRRGDVVVDYSRETPREQELRLREAKARLDMMKRAMADKRKGRALLQRGPMPPPTVRTGDESATETAGSPQLIHEYTLAKYAGWLWRHTAETHLLDEAATSPASFALLFRFDVACDPVFRSPKARMGTQLDILLISDKRVVYAVWSDHADGLLSAATRQPPVLDIAMTPFNVVAVLAGGHKPTGLGLRVTALAELARLPYLNAHAYPDGIPCELVLKSRPWGGSLGPVFTWAAADAGSSSKQPFQILDDCVDDALDEDEDEDEDRTAATNSDDIVKRQLLRAVRRRGKRQFPVCRELLDAFRPDAEARAHASAEAHSSSSSGGAIEDGEED